MKQLGLALHNFHDVEQKFPQYPSGCSSNVTCYTQNWTFVLLPYLEQANIANQQFTSLSTFQSMVRPQVVTTYICPSNPSPRTGTTSSGSIVALTNYMGITGRQRSDYKAPSAGYGMDLGVIAVTEANGAKISKIGFAAVTDGLSNTLAFAERPPVPDLSWGWAYGNPNLDSLIWARYTSADSASLGTSDSAGACPFPMYFQAPASPPRTCDGYHMWSYHPGGANFSVCDGSVRFFQYAASTQVIQDMSTRAMGEVTTE